MVSEVGRTTSGSSSVFAAADGDDGQLGRKPFDVFFFLLQEGHGDEQGEGGVDVPGGLEAPVERLLDVFP